MTRIWHYNGDINLEHGGFYWQEPDDTGTADHVYVVDVTPCSDAGGPDNLFYIEKGSIYIGTDSERIKSALACACGDETPETVSRGELVYALKAYGGIETDWSGAIQIGKAEEPTGRGGGWSPEPWRILRGNTKLHKFVEREFLNAE